MLPVIFKMEDLQLIAASIALVDAATWVLELMSIILCFYIIKKLIDFIIFSIEMIETITTYFKHPKEPADDTSSVQTNPQPTDLTPSTFLLTKDPEETVEIKRNNRRAFSPTRCSFTPTSVRHREHRFVGGNDMYRRNRMPSPFDYSDTSS